MSSVAPVSARRMQRSASVISGFLESAQRFPSRPALVVNGECLTYSDLLCIAAGITRSLLCDPEACPLAAVLAYRSRTAYAAILGILGAGKGYVPLNPKFPIERTRRMLFLSRCGVLVVGKECFAQLFQLLPLLDRSFTVILPDVGEAGHLSSQYPQHRFVTTNGAHSDTSFSHLTDVSPAATAYLLFTSGSTGEPKGVPISQSNLRAYIDYIGSRYEVNEFDRFSQEFELTFDLSVHDMFVCWERGACLFCVPDKSVMAPAKFIRDHRLTIWFSVPSVIGILDKMGLLSPACFPSLRCSLFCGEPLSARYARLWQDAAPNAVVENLYGPTETTIAITHYRWETGTSPERSLNGIVPIGWTFAGQQCAVVDLQGNEVPAGESGELCLSGSQVTSGYWNNMQRAREQFIRLAGKGEAVWYRTGDMVKQDASGCLYYLGRVDHQVKIRGYRVELQEIEGVLRKATESEQVVCLPWPVNNGSADGIVAFISGGNNKDQQRAVAFCRQFLPDYMVPQRIYAVDQMPLNANGKVDRLSLAMLLQATP